MININLNSLSGLALITGCGVAAYYYLFSNEESSNSNYWVTRKWIPQNIQKTVDTYLLPYEHSAREVLDEIYLSDSSNFHGCTLLGSGRNMDALSHEKLNQYSFIIKQPASTYGWDRRATQHLRRVQGHRVANALIQERNFTHIKATQNWLYPLPDKENSMNWGVYYLTRPARLVLKALGIGCPKWLKWADKIFIENFIVVEEFVKIQSRSPKGQLNQCNPEIVEEFVEVALAVGFQDAHDANYCFDEKGTLVLFDLDYSQKETKRLRLGKCGVDIMFACCDFAEKANELANRLAEERLTFA